MPVLPARVRSAREFISPHSRKTTILYVVGLAVLGLVFYNKWLTFTPLSSGDWGWVPFTQRQHWFPWPTVWAPEIGFGFKNFEQAYEFPIFAIAGLLTRLGLDWGVIEKLLYFWPFAILSLVSPWLLARELLGSSRWAILSALIYASNTYLVLNATVGDMFLAVGEAIAPLVLLAFIRTMRRVSVGWGLVTALLLALESAYEVRIAYLTAAVCGAYLLILLVRERGLGRRRIALAAAVGVAFLGCEAYWLLPYLTYSGDHGLPLGTTPWIAFMNLTHGITGVAPYWTWGAPSWFQTVSVNPVFFLLPLIAFTMLWSSKPSSETVWLALSALVFAFLIKQTNPPFGEVYQWMFDHLPGWNLFREASKLYFVVALAYSVLIPQAIRRLSNSHLRHRWLKVSPTVIARLAVGTIVLLATASVVPLVTGAIGSTTRPTSEPESFVAFQSVLDHDNQYGAVLWLGGPWVRHPSERPDLTVPQGEALSHRFPLLSAQHPMMEAWGQPEHDPLLDYCPAPRSSFCYIDEGLLPYVAGRLGVSYIAAPAGANVGRLPLDFPYRTLDARLQVWFGAPMVIGSGSESLAVWKLPSEPLLIAAPGVAEVNGPISATKDALPALSLLNLPVIYSPNASGVLSGTTGPIVQVVPSDLHVVPSDPYVYRARSGDSFALAAKSTSQSIQIVAGDRSRSLPRLSGAASGWGIYGPLPLIAGEQVIDSADHSVLGPLISWSPVTQQAMQTGEPAGVRIDLLQPEHVTYTPVDPAYGWLELRNTFDPGWQLAGAAVHVRGDGLLNLYSNPGGSAARTFRFATDRTENVGVLLSIVWVLVIGFACLALMRLKPSTSSSRAVATNPTQLDVLAKNAAVSGLALLALAAVTYTVGWIDRWLGISAEADLYGVSLSLILAMLALTASTLLSVGSNALRWRSPSGPGRLPQRG